MTTITIINTLHKALLNLTLSSNQFVVYIQKKHILTSIKCFQHQIQRLPIIIKKYAMAWTLP